MYKKIIALVISAIMMVPTTGFTVMAEPMNEVTEIIENEVNEIIESQKDDSDLTLGEISSNDIQNDAETEANPVIEEDAKDDATDEAQDEVAGEVQEVEADEVGNDVQTEKTLLDLTDPFIDYALNASKNFERIEAGQIIEIPAGSWIDVYTKQDYETSGCILSYPRLDGSIELLFEQFDKSNPQKGKHYFLVMPNHNCVLRKYEYTDAAATYKISYESDYFADDVYLPEMYTEGDEFNIPNLHRPGFTFEGWYRTDTNKKVTKITKNQNGDLNLCAKWKAIKYKVCFTKAGNNVSGKNITVETKFGQTISNMNNQFTRTGYHFVGWSDQKFGKAKYTGNILTDDLFSDSSVNTKTLYTVWEKDGKTDKTYRIKYESEIMLYNSDSPTVLPTYYVQGEKTVIPTIEQAGYQFLGWYNKTTGKRVKAISAKEKGDITLVAKWKHLQYKISFNKNAKKASGKMKDIKLTFDESVELPSCDYVYEGHSFSGWALEKNGTVQYKDRDIISGSIADNKKRSVVLYAVWGGEQKEEIKLSESAVELTLGESYTLCLQNGKNEIINQMAEWTSSDSAVASVDEEGNLTTEDKKTGKTTITAKYKDMTAACEVTVLEGDTISTSVRFEKPGYSLKVGENIETRVLDQEDVDVTGCVYSSDDETVAVVDENGMIHGIGEGTCKIKAVLGISSTECEVNVFKADPLIPNLKYRGHVQNVGWQSYVNDGDIAGTTGKSVRLEAIDISLTDNEDQSAISYNVYVQGKGWSGYKESGEIAGTTGESRKLHGIQIKLGDYYGSEYDVYYRVHAGNIGWLGWAKNGELSGTEDGSIRIEALQIKLVKKDEEIDLPSSVGPSISKEPFTAQAHVSYYGWISPVEENAVIGTTGKSIQLEAFKLKYNDETGKSAIKYRAHVADIGWQDWKQSNELAGTTGMSKRVEAVQIQLTGNMAVAFDIYYRAHVKDKGWLGWAKNGETAGTTGGSIRAEAIQVKIVPKDFAFDRGGSAYIGITLSGSLWLEHHMGDASNLNQLNYTDFDYTKEDGKPSNDGCGCVSYAIARSIVSGHYENPLDYRVSKDDHNCTWGRNGYFRAGFDPAAVYAGLKSGHPTIIRLPWHYLVIAGIRDGANTSNLTTSDFLVYEPWGGETRVNLSPKLDYYGSIVSYYIVY